MPGNQIVINGVVEYYVGYSRIEELLAWRDNHGTKEEMPLTSLQIIVSQSTVTSSVGR
jgi:hypothetical protein